MNYLMKHLSILVISLFTFAFAQMQLSIATGGTGGTYFPVGGAYAEIINQHIDGYSAVAEVTGASVENAGLIARGDADFALALGDTVLQAYTGTGRFEERQLDNLRAIGSAYANVVQIVTLADSGITSLADLVGKRVSVGAPGSGTEISAQTILEANGISYDDLAEAQRLNFNETANALRDGQIEAGFWSVGPPTSSLLDLNTNRDIVFISLTEEEIANAIDVSPVLTAYTMAAETYPNQTEDVHTIGTPNVILVSSDLDADLAYAFTQKLYAHIDEVIAVHPSAKNTTPEFALAATPIPLHEGALRYYQEAGFEIPEHLLEPSR